jgi:hypothetical protein
VFGNAVAKIHAVMIFVYYVTRNTCVQEPLDDVLVTTVDPSP